MKRNRMKSSETLITLSTLLHLPPFPSSIKGVKFTLHCMLRTFLPAGTKSFFLYTHRSPGPREPTSTYQLKILSFCSILKWTKNNVISAWKSWEITSLRKINKFPWYILFKKRIVAGKGKCQKLASNGTLLTWSKITPSEFSALI